MPWLILLFIALPLAELYVIIEIGSAIGALPTIAILFGDGVLGAVLLRAQGRTAWRRFNAALAEGRMPGREIFDGAMILVGGALLLTPGFITDGVGVLCLLPPSRALLRGALARRVARRTESGGPVFVWGRSGRPPGRGTGHRWPPGRGAGGRERGDPWSGPTRTPYDVEGTAEEIRRGERELPDASDDGHR